VGLGGGYGVGVERDYLGSTVKDNKSDSVLGSFGQGAKINAHIEYYINKYLQSGITLIYGLSSDYKVEQDFTTFEHYSGGGNSATYRTQNQYSHSWRDIHQWQLIPEFKLSLPREHSPYLKVGLICGLGSSITETEDKRSITYSSTFSGGSGSQLDTTEWSLKRITRYSGGVSVGFNAAIGVDIKVSKNVRFFMETSWSHLKWTPQKEQIIEQSGIAGIPLENGLKSRSFSSINLLIGVRYIFESKS
jgi:hypothetical protein